MAKKWKDKLFHKFDIFKVKLNASLLIGPCSKNDELIDALWKKIAINFSENLAHRYTYGNPLPQFDIIWL